MLAMGIFIVLPRAQPRDEQDEDLSETLEGGDQRYGVMHFPGTLTMHSLSEQPGKGFVAAVQLRRDDRIVATEQTLYWKVNTFTRYHEGRWIVDRGGDVLHDADDGSVDGHIQLDVAREQPLIEQEVRIAPFAPQFLLIAGRPITLARSSVLRLPGGGLVVDTPSHADSSERPSLRFTAWATLVEPRPAPGEKARSDDPRTVELPHDLLDLRAHAQNWLRGVDDDPQATIAALIEQLKHYRYARTFSTPPVQEDPVSHFLTTSQTGHCELFASALALMLRTQGIPARIVIGFMGGRWEPYGNYYLLTPADAHAWVEVHFAQTGWVRYEATPAAPHSATQPLTTTELPDARTAADLTHEIHWPPSLRILDAGRRQVLGSMPWMDIVSWVVGIAILLVSVRSLIPLLRYSATPVLPMRKPAAPRTMIVFFNRALNLLAFAGWRRERSETVTELGVRLRQVSPVAAEPFDQLCNHYLEQRFGTTPSDPQPELGNAATRESECESLLIELQTRLDKARPILRND
jgi:hypothetical protein